jgi:hypothetical protein
MIKNKRGLSAMIGYILLIVLGIVMSVVIFTSLRTYVPQDPLECPDGAAIFVKNATCSNGENLTITIKNNGKFNVAGYFIRGTNSAELLSTIELYENFFPDPTGEIQVLGNSIMFSVSESNSLNPGEEKISLFELDQEIIAFEIVPTRFQGEGKNQRYVTCTNAKVVEEISCG